MSGIGWEVKRSRPREEEEEGGRRKERRVDATRGGVPDRCRIRTASPFKKTREVNSSLGLHTRRNSSLWSLA